MLDGVTDLRIERRGMPGGPTLWPEKVDEMLFLAECDAALSGGEGKVMAASSLGKPGDSGMGATLGISRVDLTWMFDGFLICLGDVVFGKAESCLRWLKDLGPGLDEEDPGRGEVAGLEVRENEFLGSSSVGVMSMGVARSVVSAGSGMMDSCGIEMDCFRGDLARGDASCKSGCGSVVTEVTTVTTGLFMAEAVVSIRTSSSSAGIGPSIFSALVYILIVDERVETRSSAAPSWAWGLAERCGHPASMTLALGGSCAFLKLALRVSKDPSGTEMATYECPAAVVFAMAASGRICGWRDTGRSLDFLPLLSDWIDHRLLSLAGGEPKQSPSMSKDGCRTEGGLVVRKKRARSRSVSALNCSLATSSSSSSKTDTCAR